MRIPPNPDSGIWPKRSYIWHTLDLAQGARLYRVEVSWPPDKFGRCHKEWKIVAANRPMRAAELIAEMYAEQPEEKRPTCTGSALEIFLPKEVLDALYGED